MLFRSISPVATKDFAKRIEAVGAQYLDAPVSGGEVGAKNATLSIMVGGPDAVFERVKPLFEKMGKNITLVGGNGDGQALPRSVERIDEARRAAEAQSAVCDAIRAEIMEVFRQLDDEVDFMILFRRYILLEDWPDIAVIVRISRSQMFQRHSAAIKRLDIKSPD